MIIHDSIYEEVKNKLAAAYTQLKIGNPLDENMHVGPLIDRDAVEMYQDAMEKCLAEGGKCVVEGGVVSGEGYESGCYVKPAIFEAENGMQIVQHETFAPILYLLKYSGDVENAIAIQNDVPQGLSSAIMTTNMRESEKFLSCAGSDCGIANVNIGTSGAEIGGAFGGEKETGGGRIRFRCLENLHEETNQYDQLVYRASIGPRDKVRPLILRYSSNAVLFRFGSKKGIDSNCFLSFN